MFRINLRFKKLLLISAIVFAILIILTSSSTRAIPLDSREWGSWDIAYSEQRYNMALWLFKTEWFDGKTREDVQKDLPNRNQTEITANVVTFELKYSNKFMERWNIDYTFRPIAELDVYFGDKGEITKAVLRERKHVENEYVNAKVWSLS